MLPQGPQCSPGTQCAQHSTAGGRRQAPGLPSYPARSFARQCLHHSFKQLFAAQSSRTSATPPPALTLLQTPPQPRARHKEPISTGWFPVRAVSPSLAGSATLPSQCHVPWASHRLQHLTRPLSDLGWRPVRGPPSGLPLHAPQSQRRRSLLPGFKIKDN
ncbi:hypothetical protein NDU88_004819 [Pleurodeles waltl]|uniref:Uncharacterized protein n=1 Tax=Pleurodeles waltl TaxID=8319 RepID=A0AAV7MW88_PLEWA|nr:hypothetical protein NDU88_004819 [Pleurodeles waltl]